jgi:hypothetical protein
MMDDLGSRKLFEAEAVRLTVSIEKQQLVIRKMTSTRNFEGFAAANRELERLERQLADVKKALHREVKPN